MGIDVIVPSFKKIIHRIEKIARFDPRDILEEIGAEGVRALSNATPVDSGETAAAWGYKIEGNRDRYKLIWTNSSVTAGGGVPIILLLQYGHATKSGWYISGRDIINPALEPIYKALMRQIGQEVSK